MCCSGGFTGIGTLPECYDGCKEEWDICLEWRKSIDRKELRKKQKAKEERRRRQQWKNEMDERRKQWEESHPPNVATTKVQRSALQPDANTLSANSTKIDLCRRTNASCLKKCKSPNSHLFCEVVCLCNLQDCKKHSDDSANKVNGTRIIATSMESATNVAAGDTHCEFQRVKCAQKCSKHTAIVFPVFKHLNIFCSNRCDRQYWGCLHKEHHKHDKDGDDMLEKRDSDTNLDTSALEPATSTKSIDFAALDKMCRKVRETCNMKCNYFIFGCEKNCTREYESCVGVRRPRIRPTEAPSPRVTESTYIRETETLERIEDSYQDDTENQERGGHAIVARSVAHTDRITKREHCTRMQATCSLYCYYFGLACHEQCSAVYEKCLGGDEDHADLTDIPSLGSTTVPRAVIHTHAASIPSPADAASGDGYCSIEKETCITTCTHWFLDCYQSCNYIYMTCVLKNKDSSVVNDGPETVDKVHAASLDMPPPPYQSCSQTMEACLQSCPGNAQDVNGKCESRCVIGRMLCEDVNRLPPPPPISRNEKRFVDSAPQGGRNCDAEKGSYISQCVARKVASSPLPPKAKDGSDYAREAAKHGAQEAANWQCEARSHQSYQRCQQSNRRSSKGSIRARDELSTVQESSSILREDCWAEEDYCIHECEGGTDMEIQGCRWYCKDDYKRCLDTQNGKTDHSKVKRSVAEILEEAQTDLPLEIADEESLLAKASIEEALPKNCLTMREVCEAFCNASVPFETENTFQTCWKDCQTLYTKCEKDRSSHKSTGNGGEDGMSIEANIEEKHIASFASPVWLGHPPPPINCTTIRQICMRVRCDVGPKKTHGEYRLCQSECKWFYRDKCPKDKLGQRPPTNYEGIFAVERRDMLASASLKEIFGDDTDDIIKLGGDVDMCMIECYACPWYKQNCNRNAHYQSCIKKNCHQFLQANSMTQGDQHLIKREQIIEQAREEFEMIPTAEEGDAQESESVSRTAELERADSGCIQRGKICASNCESNDSDCKLKCLWQAKFCMHRIDFARGASEENDKGNGWDVETDALEKKDLVSRELEPTPSNLPSHPSWDHAWCTQIRKKCLHKCSKVSEVHHGNTSNNSPTEQACNKECQVDHQRCLRDEFPPTNSDRIEARDAESMEFTSSGSLPDNNPPVSCILDKVICDIKCGYTPRVGTNYEINEKFCKGNCAQEEKKCLKEKSTAAETTVENSPPEAPQLESRSVDEAEASTLSPGNPWLRYKESSWCTDIANHCAYACGEFRLAHEHIGQSERECRASCRGQFKACLARYFDGPKSIFSDKKDGRKHSKAVVG